MPIWRSRSRNARDLVPTGLALADAPAETLEGFEEEGADVARLKAASFRSLHVFADLRDALGAQRLAAEGAFFEQGRDPLAIDGRVDDPIQARLHLGAERIAELEAKIAGIKQRSVTKKAKALPEGQALVLIARALDKAISVVAEAGRTEMVRALESSRAGVSEQLVVLGVRLPDRKAKRGGRPRKEVA